MTRDKLLQKLGVIIAHRLPLPGAGQTPLRHQILMEIGREDLSLARLAEAHCDAVAILAEAGRQPVPGALYGVWASEIPGHELQLSANFTITGTKRFCSGAGLLDRTLLTVNTPEPALLDIDLRGPDLRAHATTIHYDDTAWHTTAFAETKTATTTFTATPTSPKDQVGPTGFYTTRPGFWHGACGPASCWAGGAIGLVDYARTQARNDPHTLAHIGAMHAAAWALQSFLETAGREIDAHPTDATLAHIRALTLRHLVEQASTDILRRIPRAFGPTPLAMDAEISRRYHELDLYLRQSHAERDLESLGREARLSPSS